MIGVVHPGVPDPDFLPIPDTGARGQKRQRIPDHGSGSATLDLRTTLSWLSLTYWPGLVRMDPKCRHCPAERSQRRVTAAPAGKPIQKNKRLLCTSTCAEPSGPFCADCWLKFSPIYLMVIGFIIKCCKFTSSRRYIFEVENKKYARIFYAIKASFS